MLTIRLQHHQGCSETPKCAYVIYGQPLTRSLGTNLLQPVLYTESHFTLEDILDPIQSVSVKNQSGQNPLNLLRFLDIVQLQLLYLHVGDPLAQLRWCAVSCILSL